VARVTRELSELQREKTAELLLNVAQGLVLGLIVAVILPGLQAKIRLVQVIVGVVTIVVLYLVGIGLLRGLERK